MQRDQLAPGVETTAQIMRRKRIEATVADVVLARPHHLHRLFDRVRQHDRVMHEFLVAVAAPAETATHQHVVEHDLVRRDAERRRRHRHGNGLRLHADPDLDRIALRRHGGHPIQRLHLRVIEEAAAIIGLDDHRRALQHLRHVTFLDPVLHGTLLRIARGGGIGHGTRVAVEAPGLAVARPRDLEGFLHGERGPWLLGDNADAVWQGHDGDDAGSGACLRVADLVERSLPLQARARWRHRACRAYKRRCCRLPCR